MGYFCTIGEIDKRPICISVFFNYIGGIYVMSVKLTSRLCDYKMMEDWLIQYCPAYKDRLNNTCNSANFHILIHKIKV